MYAPGMEKQAAVNRGPRQDEIHVRSRKRITGCKSGLYSPASGGSCLVLLKKQIIIVAEMPEVLRMVLIGIVPSRVEEKKITVNQGDVEAVRVAGKDEGGCCS